MECDALVVGSGISALAYALPIAEAGRRVVIVTKREADEANTRYAQGGIAAVLSPEDSVESHVQDTLKAGAGLCHPEVVSTIVQESRAAIDRLIGYGVQFDRRDGDSAYDLTREGGHSQRRVLHAGDITGTEVMRGMLSALEQLPNVTILEQHCAVDLLTERRLDALRVGPAHRAPRTSNRCLGAYVLDVSTGQVITVLAKAVMLGAGGASKVYLYTSNPDVATGDGVAMAWRAGAEVANMEFIQFHPTCLFHPKAKSFLISEALRGEGGRLVREDGSRFMPNYDPQAELAPRDIVARAIDSELKRTGNDCVFLDMTHLDAGFLEKRFPNIHETCLGFGVDMRKEPIPVVPAAHYVCGGVRCNVDGETSIPGLFVAGEVACSGMHGANRLASNSLLEGAVLGHRAAAASKAFFDAPLDAEGLVDWQPGRAVPSDELVVITQCWDEIRRLMWNYVGIVRSDRRLLRARNRLQLISEEIREYYWNATVSRDLVELRNISSVAELIVDCALRRKESRGLHFTLDYPELSSGHPQDTILRRADLI